MAYNIIEMENIYLSMLQSENKNKDEEKIKRVCISLYEIKKTKDLVDCHPTVNLNLLINNDLKTILHLIKICIKYDSKENIINFLNNCLTNQIICSNVKLNDYIYSEKVKFYINLQHVATNLNLVIKNLVILLKSYGLIVNYVLL